jgi:subtilisin family serine protease
MRRLAGAVVGWICLLFVAGLPVIAQEAGDIVPGRIIVTFRETAGPPDELAPRLAYAHGAQLRHTYRYAFRGMAIDVAPAAADRVLAALRRDPRVRSAGFDRYVRAVAQTVPKGVDRINAEPGKRANTGSGVRVAIFDSGLDFNHADLAPNIDIGLSRNCIGGCKSGGQDDNGHGTFVGGIVAAVDNNQDVIGAAPAVTLIAVKVLGANGSGSFADIIAGVDYVISLNQSGTFIDVGNMSLGATCSVCTDTSSDPTISAFHDAVRALVNSGTTLVVAAGNDGRDAANSVPASFDEVITVSALADSDGQPGGSGPSMLVSGAGRMPDDSFAKFSNFGADVDVIAPGVNELSLRLGGGTSTGSGTSFSSPYAAAVAAIFIRDQLSRGNPRPAPGTVRQALIETGECPGNGTQFFGSTGCSTTWRNDPDGITEPLVRADKVVNFGGAGSTPVHDVAVTAISVPGSAVVNTTESVDVGVANQGTESETFSVTLTDSLAANISNAQSVTLAAGASATLTFLWTPTLTGNHVLTATASVVSGETDTADNTKSATVSVSAGSTSGITLTATGFKDRGLQKTDLAWSGATSAFVDVYRNGVRIATTENDGAFRDDINVRGGGSYTYQVCEAGTNVCSNQATVVF